MRSTFFLPLLALPLTLAANLATADADSERRIEERLKKLEQSSGNSISDTLKIAGVIEIEAGLGEDYDDQSYSSLDVATVEIGLSAEVAKNISAEIIFLYEGGETEFDVDAATLSFNELFGPVNLLVGKQYVPFGRFETALVNDTLILEIAETNKTAALFGIEQGALSAGAYLFGGDADRQEHVENWGLTVTFAQDNLSVGADYISSLAETDGLVGLAEEEFAGAELKNDDGAFAVSASFASDNLTIIAEYLTAVSDIEWAQGANEISVKPSAIQLELDFATELSGKDVTIGFAVQETDELGGFLPEQRISFGASTAIHDNVSVGLEYWMDNDYDDNDGGSGEKSNNIVFQVAAEF